MRTALVCVLAFALLAPPAAQARRTTLDIYVVDVEGGNATLFVSPSGESLLMDTGNGGVAAARDADRIMAAVNDAGLTRIDHLITTHWHSDHFGAMAALAGRIPIRHFIDHGPSVESQPASDVFQKDTYPGLYAKAKHTVVKPGAQIPIAGLDWRVVTSGGEVIQKPLPGAGRPNPYCASFKPQDADTTDNAQSVGSVISFGEFRAVHLGDLTWNKEFDLIEDLWQVHFSSLSGQEYTVPGMFIANIVDQQPDAMPVAPVERPGPGAAPAPVHNGAAYWIKVSAQQDGTFTVTNRRNGFSKIYRPR